MHRSRCCRIEIVHSYACCRKRCDHLHLIIISVQNLNFSSRASGAIKDASAAASAKAHLDTSPKWHVFYT
jgi:hypothetical protein